MTPVKNAVRLAAVIVFVLLVSACGSGATPVATNTAASGSTSTATTQATSTGDAVFQAAADPVNATITTDAASAATQLLTVAGGSLSTTDANGNKFTLTIPANALTGDTVITMTPITGMTGVSFASGIVAGVQLAPDGLILQSNAVLTIVPASPVPVVDQTLFGALTGGNDLHFASPGPDYTQMQLSIPHFSFWGFLFMTPQERLTEISLKVAADNQVRLEHWIGKYLGNDRQKAIAGVESLDTPTLDQLKAYFDSYYSLVVSPRVRAASTSCVNAMLALETLTKFNRLLEITGQGARPDFAQDLATVQQAMASIGKPCYLTEIATASSTRGAIFTKVRWRISDVSGTVYTYKPSTGTATASFPDKNCTVSNQNHDVDPGSGLLTIDFSNNPPTYHGQGIANWPVHVSCPKQQPPFQVDLILPGNYLGLNSEASGVTGPKAATIDGTATAGTTTVDWHFTSCDPSTTEYCP